MRKVTGIWLPNGMVSLVDVADLQIVLPFKWHAWAIGNTFYVGTGTTPRTYLHRLILNAPRGFDVDHINGDGLDNRRSNLRVCSHRDNVRNQKIRPDRGTSRFKGVSWDRDRNRWAATIRVGRTIHLGRYHSDEAAARAYDDAALRYFGAFARLNFPK